MERRIVLLLLVAGIAIAWASPTPSLAQPRRTWEPLPKPDAREEAVARQRRRDLVEIGNELRFRRIVEEYRSRGEEPDVELLEATVARATNPAFRIMSRDSLVIKTEEIELDDRRRYVTYGDRTLSFVFAEVADSVAPATSIEGIPFISSNTVELSGSVVAIIPRSAFTVIGDDHYMLHTEPLTTVLGYEVCSADRFYMMPSVRMEGTGFLIDNGRVVTAGHVARRNPAWLKTVYFVFDYMWNADGTPDTLFDASQIYEGKTLLGSYWDGGGLDVRDWAVIELTEIPDRAPLQYRHEGEVAAQEPLTMIGHPYGIAQAISHTAVVTDTTGCCRFRATLDNYRLNSGSPVFNQDNLVEGILVHDLQDFALSGDCYIHVTVDPEEDPLMGAEISRTSQIAEWLTHPSTVLVRNQETSGVLSAGGTEYLLSAPETNDTDSAAQEIAIPGTGHPNGELYITLGGNTILVHVGERWEIVESADSIELRQVCNP